MAGEAFFTHRLVQRGFQSIAPSDAPLRLLAVHDSSSLLEGQCTRLLPSKSSASP